MPRRRRSAAAAAAAPSDRSDQQRQQQVGEASSSFHRPYGYSSDHHRNEDEGALFAEPTTNGGNQGHSSGDGTSTSRGRTRNRISLTGRVRGSLSRSRGSGGSKTKSTRSAVAAASSSRCIRRGSSGGRRRRSFSLSRRGTGSSFGGSSRRRGSFRDDEFGRYASSPAADGIDHDEGGEEGVHVISQLGLPSTTTNGNTNTTADDENDDFLFEDYDPARHGPLDTANPLWGCGGTSFPNKQVSAGSGGNGRGGRRREDDGGAKTTTTPTLGSAIQKCINDAEDSCVNFINGLAACGLPAGDKCRASLLRRRSNRRGSRRGGGGGEGGRGGVGCSDADGTGTLASLSSAESRTLATNDMPLKNETASTKKKKESRLGSYLRRSRSPERDRRRGSGGSKSSKDGRRGRSLSRDGGRGGESWAGAAAAAAAAAEFNPYGDDDAMPTPLRSRSMERQMALEEQKHREELEMRRNRPPSPVRSSSMPLRSRSIERKLAKWKAAKKKLKGGKSSADADAKSPQSVAEVPDWRSLRDEILSNCEEGQFITYEAGRVRSSTKKRGDGAEGVGCVDRFLYI